MFFQSEEDSRSQGGSGIGLYLVDQYIKMHGGSVQVAGNQPRGTVFQIDIPLASPVDITSEPAMTVPAESSEIRVYSSQSRQYEYTLLLVDDNLEFLDFVSDSLSSLYRIYHASDGTSALDILQKEHIDLVISDVMMPNMSGLELCQKIRSDRKLSGIPVILLTAKSEDTDKVLGLNLGADDYVTKPFNPVELLARVRSQLRRYMQLGGGQSRESVLSVGGVELDDRSKLVTADGEAVPLTPREYDILKLLMENAGEVFSPKEIYRRVWNEEPYGAESTVAVHIRHLREKLEIDPGEPRCIRAIWGQGYKFERPGAAKTAGREDP